MEAERLDVRILGVEGGALDARCLEVGAEPPCARAYSYSSSV